MGVLYGANTCGELVALYRLQQLGASCRCTTLDESLGVCGVVTDLLPQAIETLHPDFIYTLSLIHISLVAGRIVFKEGSVMEMKL